MMRLLDDFQLVGISLALPGDSRCAALFLVENGLVAGAIHAVLTRSHVRSRYVYEIN